MTMTDQMRIVLKQHRMGKTLKDIGMVINRSPSVVGITLKKALREVEKQLAVADGIFRTTKIDDLPLSARARNCLLNARYLEVGDIFDTVPYDLMEIPNLGKESAAEVHRILLRSADIPASWKAYMEKGKYLMTKPKQFDRMMTNLERAMEIAPSHAGTIIADAAQALHKAIRIAEAGESWERFDLTPTAGPRTSFMGRRLWRSTYDNWEGRQVERALYETQAGAMVAVTVSFAMHEGEGDRVTVHVSDAHRDAAAQQAEIMAAWRWDDGAMKMAKKLGWNTAVWID